jgi:hypothetical protein
MNVKQGDMAIVIYSLAGNEGLIVEVIRFLGDAPEYGGHLWKRGVTGPWWLVESHGSPIKDTSGGLWQAAPLLDANLRKISGLPDTEDTETKEPIKEIA